MQQYAYNPNHIIGFDLTLLNEAMATNVESKHISSRLILESKVLSNMNAILHADCGITWYVHGIFLSP